MTAQTSNQPLEERPVNENVAVSPEEAATMLARIDAILDELYTMRQTVLGWMAAQPYTPAGGVNTVREPAREFVADAAGEMGMAPDIRRSDTPLTDFLAGAAGRGTWDEVYTNAEIVHMRFGEE